MLQIIEAVDGPMINQLNLVEQSGKEKFSYRVERAYDKAISQAKSAYQKVKLSELVK